MLVCRGGNEVGGAYTLTRLTTVLATLVASPGAPAKFAKEGLLGEALLALAGMSAVEVGRTHLTGLRHSPGSVTPMPAPLPIPLSTSALLLPPPPQPLCYAT